MRTMAEIDAWYEAEMNKARLEGKLEGILEAKLEAKLEGKLEGKLELANIAIRAKFGAEFLTPQIASQLKKLNCQQVDDFVVRMLNWQQPKEMEEWLLQFV